MSLSRTSRSWIAGARAPLCAGALLLGLTGAMGCQPYPTFKSVPLDCTASDGYDFDTVDNFDLGENIPWFGSGDDLCSDGGRVPAVPPVLAIEGGGRCGSNAAMVVTTQGCNDWGAVFGDYSFGSRDESAYEGLSFWARAPGDTGKGFTIILDDTNTAANTTGSTCHDYTGDAGVGVQVVDPVTGMPISGVPGVQPRPDQCGNGYSTVQQLTTDWLFYTMPFERFTQVAQPNRVPNQTLTQAGNVPGTGILTSALRNLTFRMPKESRMEIWIDNLAFYRKKGAATGADAGADAVQGQ